MEAGFEKANCLDVCDLQALAGPGRVPTLAAMGLAQERLFRCTVDDRVVWIRLEGAE